MVVSLYQTLEMLIEAYFWVFFIAAPVSWYVLRPMADMVLKIAAYACVAIGVVGGVLFLAARL